MPRPFPLMTSLRRLPPLPNPRARGRQTERHPKALETVVEKGGTRVPDTVISLTMIPHVVRVATNVYFRMHPLQRQKRRRYRVRRRWVQQLLLLQLFLLPEWPRRELSVPKETGKVVTSGTATPS